jgi:GAF domain-containing protein
MARSVALTTGADLACLYYYDYERNELVIFGAYHNVRKGSGCELDLPQVQKELSEASKKPSFRAESIVYRCIDSGGVPQICYAFDRHTGASDPPNSPLFRFSEGIWPIRAANVSPINVRGRPWGAIAILGRRPYQFSSTAASAIDDLAGLFSFTLFNQWTLKHLDLINAAATDRSLHLRDRYFALCKHVARLLLSESIVLWVCDPGNPQKLYAAGWVDRTDLDDLAKQGENILNADDLLRQQQLRICFDLSDTKTVTGRILDHGWEEPYVNILGQGWLDDKWLSKPYTRNLLRMGYKFGCFVPLRLDDKTIGSLSLYNRHGSAYNTGWLSIIKSIARELALVIQGLLERDEFRRSRLGLIRHEILPLIKSVVDDRLPRVDKILEQDQLSNLPQLRNLRLKFDDVSNILSDVEARLNVIAENPDNEEMFFSKVRARAQKPAYQPCRVRDLFKEITAQLREKYSYKFVSFLYRGDNYPLDILIDHSDVRMMLSNYLENAAKYCPPHDQIVFSVENGRRTMKVHVLNSGPILPEEEQEQMWMRHARGISARERSIPGMGLGLYYVKQLADIYDLEVYHRQIIQSGSRGTALHRFSLEFTSRWVQDRVTG